MKVLNICVGCNIISGVYMHSVEGHTLFEFDIDVEPCCQISKETHNYIYMPLMPAGRQFIDNIILRILDYNGDAVD